MSLNNPVLMEKQQCVIFFGLFYWQILKRNFKKQKWSQPHSQGNAKLALEKETKKLLEWKHLWKVSAYENQSEPS